MFFEQFEQQTRIYRIILLAAGVKGGAELGQGLRVDGVEHQAGVAAQGVEERAAALLQADRDGAGSQTLAQGADPGGDRFRGVGEGAVLDGGRARGAQSHVVFFIGPVQTQEGGELVEVSFFFHCSCVSCCAWARWPWLREALIADSSGRDIQRIRLEPRRRAGSEGLSQ